MSRPEVDNNVPDLFQMVNETLVPFSRKKEASEHSTVSGQMERSETSTNLSGGVESRHAKLCGGVGTEMNSRGATSEMFGSDERESVTASCLSGSSAPPAQNNLPVPVLADSCKPINGGSLPSDRAERLPETDSGLCGEARESKRGVRPLRVAERLAIDGHSRGGQNTLSASVRDRTAQLATALDAENTFDGETYEPDKDRTRLKAQLIRVRELMRDGVWRSLSEISAVTGDPESSVSARLRDCRKARFGMWTVNRRRRSPGTFEYSFGGKGL